MKSVRRKVRSALPPRRTALFDDLSIPKVFLESAADAMMVCDREGVIVFANPSAEKMFGWDRRDLLGRTIEVLMPERFRSRHVGLRNEFFEAPRERVMGAYLNLTALRKDGIEFPVEISLSPVTAPDGPVVLAVVRDISYRRWAEGEIQMLNRDLENRVAQRTAELRQERDLLQKYLDVAGVLIVVIRDDESISLINRFGCERLGYVEEELIGRNWFDLCIPEQERAGVRAAFARLMSGEIAPVEYYENRVLTKSGEERSIAWRNTVLRDSSGRIKATLSSGLDVTEKLMLEEQVRQAEKLAAVGQLVSGLAHEIGTPLNVIAGRAEYMLRKLGAGDPLRENLDRIIHQIERITRIVNQLLGFTRIKPPEIRRVRIVPLLEELLSLFESQLLQHGITASLDGAQPLPEIEADPDQIQQVFFNLILNAIQAMPAGGKLEIRAARTAPRAGREDADRDRYLRIELADTGVGIAPENLGRVFDPFFSTKEAGKGTGLGLSVSASIVKSHLGRISVRSRAGEGSVFTVFLPIPSAGTPALKADTGGEHGQTNRSNSGGG